jgi:hypothetical protein
MWELASMWFKSYTPTWMQVGLYLDLDLDLDIDYHS